MGEIKLRRAGGKDIDEILKIEKSVDGTKIYSALTDRNDVMKCITDDVFYLIEKNNEIVGDVSYELKEKGSAYLSGLVIMPEFQGQGIAREVISVILEELKNVRMIELFTHPENKKSISLYTSLGFKETGERLENYFGDGEPRIKMTLKNK
ncbi:MAG: GNAT family N-acetyltransferase [Candidatus Staskawiczbacteria bacterium]|jgi:ribosomal protein S18 acetylase RimI-like enzyme